MSIAALSALLSVVATGVAGAESAGISQQRQTLACAVALRSAADGMRETQGDSVDARALTLSASAAEERYRRQAATDGLNPLQIEIALAAEREAGPGSPELLGACLKAKAVNLSR